MLHAPTSESTKKFAGKGEPPEPARRRAPRTAVPGHGPLAGSAFRPGGVGLRPSRGGLLQRKCACGGTPGPTGECAECRAERLGLQRRSADRAEKRSEAPPVVHEALRSPGQPLDPAIRTFMEPRFGHDFSRVRVHTDARAAESARAVQALAYTVGNDVVFEIGQYAPGSTEGKRLLAHELTHVVQQRASDLHGKLYLDIPENDPFELEAERAGQAIETMGATSRVGAPGARAASGTIQRRVRSENVTCRRTGLTNPDLTGGEAVAAIEAADTEAIDLAQRAELLLDVHLLFTRAGDPVDAEFDTILQEELGLTLTNPAHFGLIEQQRDRFLRVRETLESGFLRYMCRGGTVTLVGCGPGTCGEDFAFTCPGNRLVVLCQAFWDDPAERPGTILHEPFHIWFDMARHEPNALRRADSSCFEAFARRLAGEAAPPMSCVGHTAG